MSVIDCTNKVMRFMERAVFTKGARTGNQALGSTENAIVLVFCTPQNNGVYISIVAASADSSEAEKLRNAVREYVFDGPNDHIPGPDVINNGGLCSPGTVACGPVQHYPVMHWGSDSRSRNVEACIGDSKAAMRIKDLEMTTSSGGSAVWGSNADVISLVQCVSVDHGVYIIVVAAGDDAERYRNDIREFVFK